MQLINDSVAVFAALFFQYFNGQSVKLRLLERIALGRLIKAYLAHVDAVKARDSSVTFDRRTNRADNKFTQKQRFRRNVGIGGKGREKSERNGHRNRAGNDFFEHSTEKAHTYTSFIFKFAFAV